MVDRMFWSLLIRSLPFFVQEFNQHLTHDFTIHDITSVVCIFHEHQR